MPPRIFLTVQVTAVVVERGGAARAVDYEAVVRFPSSYPDRAAFEREFNLSASALDVGVNEMGKAAREDPDFEARHGLNDRWLVFLVWRQLRREQPAVPSKFTMFEEQIEEVAVTEARVEGIEDEGSDSESVDPTGPAAVSAPAPQPGTSPASLSATASTPRSSSRARPKR